MSPLVIRSQRRTRTGRAALLIAALALVWTAWLLLFGGFEVYVHGVRLKSNEPLRAFTVASLALVGYAATLDLVGTLAGWTSRLLAIEVRRVMALLAAATCGIGVIYATTAAIGPDPYGYVSQADLWLNGRLSVPQPWALAVPWPSPEWTFSPLAYRPAVGTEAASSIVPIYSPGLPLLMSALKGVAGQEALFWAVPLCGALLALATYGIGCRLHSPRAGLIAAWLVVTSPTFLFVLMPPLSDIPAAAAWAIAIYFALGSTTSAAAASGLATAVAILIRPNLVPLAAALALRPFMSAVSTSTRGAALRQLAAFGLVAATGPLAIAIINSHLYGSPTISGYGDLSVLFSWSHVLPNFERYMGWIADSQTPIALAGLAAVLAPARWLWPRVSDRRMFVPLAVSVLLLWAQYLAYVEFDVWWFLRFLLPAWPLMMLGVAMLAIAATRRIPPAFAIVTAWLIFMLGADGVQLAAARGAFSEWRTDRRHIDVAERVRQATEGSSVIYASHQSGTLRYYASRQTLRYEFLDGTWLDRSVEWFAAHGVHPYVLFVNRDEIEDFRRRFAGQQAAEQLDRSLVFTYSDEGNVYFYFYDLLPGTGRSPRVETSGDLTRLRSLAPAVTPPLLVTP